MAGVHRFSESRGVSDVVATILLLGMTVALFTGLTIVVADQLKRNPPATQADFRVDSGNGWTFLTPVWGEALALDNVLIEVDVDGVEQKVRLSSTPLAENIGHESKGSTLWWEVGETLRLACPVAETCAYQGSTIGDLTIIQEDAAAIIFVSGGP